MKHAAGSVVPVFPLPELVLFPGVMVQLHVFELRYLTMVRDALSRDRTLALAVLIPGYELDYHGSPQFHPMGCLGRVEQAEWLPDDRYDLKVVGTTRVRFVRIEREFPYRSARVELLPQHPYAEDDPLVQLDKRALLELHERLARLFEAQGGDAAQQGLPDADPGETYEAIVNRLSSVCGGSAEERLALLAEDSVIARGRRLRELLEHVLGTPEGPKRPGPPDGERN
jgi:Lon protease-like protein